MPDGRVVEGYVERVTDLITALTRQVSRLAYAVEMQVIHTGNATIHREACPACGSWISFGVSRICGACLYQEKKSG